MEDDKCCQMIFRRATRCGKEKRRRQVKTTSGNASSEQAFTFSSTGTKQLCRRTSRHRRNNRENTPSFTDKASECIAIILMRCSGEGKLSSCTRTNVLEIFVNVYCWEHTRTQTCYQVKSCSQLSKHQKYFIGCL